MELIAITIFEALLHACAALSSYYPSHRNYSMDFRFFRTFSGLTSVPRDITPESRELHLYGNNITNIDPSAIDNFTINGLYLDYNSISDLDFLVSTGLRNLSVLSVDNNVIERLYPDMFQHVDKLTVLSLKNNVVSYLGTGTFRGLSNLSELHLSGNQLTVVTSGDFLGLTAIEELSLDHNGIVFILDGAFSNIPTLLLLWLHNNVLREINSRTFSGLNSLEQLTLYSNRISTIDEYAFLRSPAGLVLAISDPFYMTSSERDVRNPLICDVTLCWLKTASDSGQVEWYVGEYNGTRRTFSPVCTNGVEWGRFLCFSTTSVTPVPMTTTTDDRDREDEDDDDVTWLPVVIALVLFILTVTGMLRFCGRRNDRFCPFNPEGGAGGTMGDNSRTRGTSDNIGTTHNPGYIHPGRDRGVLNLAIVPDGDRNSSQRQNQGVYSVSSVVDNPPSYSSLGNRSPDEAPPSYWTVVSQ